MLIGWRTFHGCALIGSAAAPAASGAREMRIPGPPRSSSAVGTRSSAKQQRGAGRGVRRRGQIILCCPSQPGRVGCRSPCLGPARGPWHWQCGGSQPGRASSLGLGSVATTILGRTFRDPLLDDAPKSKSASQLLVLRVAGAKAGAAVRVAKRSRCFLYDGVALG